MAQEIADSTLLDTWSSSGAKIEPDISKIIEGWQLGEQPPHEYMNWLQNTFGSKLNHILKNGVAKWNDETEYLAGATAQHNGNVWLCKTTNTNSAPTDVNANWKRIITVEALTTVLAGYVSKTGNEDIDDVKTFTSSPIVPTPTTGTQAANKDYVDSVATLNINPLPDKTTPDDTDNFALQEAGGDLKKVSFANLMAWIKSFSFGWGQTLQDVKASRDTGVTYTNNTGKPIHIFIQGGSNSASITVGGLTTPPTIILGSAIYRWSFIVPAGDTYRLNTVLADSWFELR